MQPGAAVFVYDNITNYAPRGGVARYFHKILRALEHNNQLRLTVYSPLRVDGGAATRIRAIPSTFRGSRLLRIRDINDWRAGALAKRLRPQLALSVYYGPVFNVPHIFTVYDMIHELFPQYFPPQDSFVERFVREKRSCIDQAALLFAISQSTANDIRRVYPHVDANKIVITPLGVDAFFFEASTQPPMFERPYLLFVGNRDLYKNFIRLLDAFGRSGLAGSYDLRVISPYSAALTGQEMQIIAQHKLHNQVKLVSAASEQQLRAFYSQAAAFVYPSEYEGFGLPILEAMASGTIVAAAATSSLREVGCEVALYFDPYNVDELAHTLQRAVGLSSEERRSRIEQGIAHARTFSWSRCQAQTVAAIDQLLHNQPVHR